MEVLVKDPPTKKVVTKEEMNLMISAAERLSDEVARVRGNHTSSTVMLLIVLGIVTSFLTGIAVLGIQYNVGALGFVRWIFFAFIITLGVYSAFLVLRVQKRIDRRIKLLSSSLSSLMGMINEARIFLDEDLTPMERHVMELRLRTVTLS